MKHTFLISTLVFLTVSCEKDYNDYNPRDFYEVQGIVTDVIPTQNPFDDPWDSYIYWEYHFDRHPPLKGSEKETELMINKGYPIVVLVHKDDINISFFGRLGFSNDSLHQEWIKKQSKQVLTPR